MSYTDYAACARQGLGYCLGTNWHSYSLSDGSYAGHNSSGYYATYYKFKTPAFVGVSSSLHFSLWIRSLYAASVTLRWALTASDSGFDYANTYSAVGTDTDPDQLYASVGTFSGLNTSTAVSKGIDIDLQNLQPSTVYFLVIWAGSSGTNAVEIGNINAYNNYVTVYYNKGLANVDSGTELESYTAHIDSGASYDLYIPYVDDGTQWSILT